MPNNDNKGLVIWFNKDNSRHRKPKKRYNPSATDTLRDRINQSVKQLDGGKSNPQFASYKYKQPKSYRNGDKVPKDQDVTTPSGEHWKNESETVTHHVKDYENSDIFSDFDGNFFLQKIGNQFHCWIQVVSSHVINDDGTPGDQSSRVHNLKICDRTWTDEDGSHSFALSSIAAYFAKHNIMEDGDKDHPLHAYNDVNMGCGAVKYWNILDGGYTQNNKPHLIAHKGETVIIDTAKMKVYKTDGTDLTKYTSFGTIFPPIYGNRVNKINFYPTVGDGCEVNIQYVPRIK